MTERPLSEIDLGFLEDGAAYRARLTRRRSQLAVLVSAAVTALWIGYVSGGDHWGRVLDRWVAALTMVFGSFVAGSTPQGGGAVAFPVFTKVLDIQAPVARSFSLCIQAVGMGTAAAAIVIQRRPVVWRAVAYIAPTASAAFLVTVFLTGNRSDPFWASQLPSAYTKVSFTLVVAALAVVVYLGWRLPIRYLTARLADRNRRVAVGMLTAGALGGIASALLGSGVDVFVYLLLVVLLGFEPRIGVATSVVCMAIVSWLGLLVFGHLDGQLNIAINDDVVTAVGSHQTTLPVARFDLFGLWLAAVPVVAWGAPLGSYVASRVNQRNLVAFVMVLAAVEVSTTVIFLDELRQSVMLVAYFVGLGLLTIGGMVWLSANRQRVFALDGVGSESTLRREDLDVSSDYVKRLQSKNLSGGKGSCQ